PIIIKPHTNFHVSFSFPKSQSDLRPINKYSILAIPLSLFSPSFFLLICVHWISILELGLHFSSQSKMNRCGYERSSTAAAIGAEETVICPKPRRFGALNPSIHGFRLLPPSPPLRRYQFDVVDDSRAGAELFDLILSKGGYNLPQSPPFYSGSPPSRATNPVIEDAEFGTQRRTAASPPWLE
ncbi:hypothetical protein LINPERHAP1_LOCUS5576, partial [Linum perenne]